MGTRSTTKWLEHTDIAINNGKIEKIGKQDLTNSKVFDAKDKIVLPGIIDTQVHFREPGSTDREDLESGRSEERRVGKECRS